MSVTRKKIHDEKLKRMYQDLDDYAAGKVAHRTWIVSETGERTLLYETLPQARAREARQAGFKAIRAKLGLTQPKMAAAMRVSVNTLKGWEAGKPIPEVAFTLAEVLNDFPAVRKRLMAA
jgi:DNA-binding transcriptional regulator YiaG